MRGRDAPLHPGSAAVALVAGGIEVLGLLVDRLHLTGSFWGLMGKLNDNFGVIGYFIIGGFIASWAMSLAFYKWRRFDDLEPGRTGARHE